MKKILNATGWIFMLFGFWMLMGIYVFIDFKVAAIDGQIIDYLILPTGVFATKEFMILFSASLVSLGTVTVSFCSKY